MPSELRRHAVRFVLEFVVNGLSYSFERFARPTCVNTGLKDLVGYGDEGFTLGILECPLRYKRYLGGRDVNLQRDQPRRSARCRRGSR